MDRTYINAENSVNDNITIDEVNNSTIPVNDIQIQPQSEHENEYNLNANGNDKKNGFSAEAEHQLQQIMQSHNEQHAIAESIACDTSSIMQLPHVSTAVPATTSSQAMAISESLKPKEHFFGGIKLTSVDELLEEIPQDLLELPPESPDATPTSSIRSIGSLVCRICHNSENPEALVSPCLCKGSLTYVHVHCLERWISTSRSTVCELCQFQYNTEQTLRYSCLQSLRMWYSRSMSRRALQEDCQMFSLLTLIAFAIVGTLLVGIQFYFMQGHTSSLTRIWTKGWLVFFLFTTLSVYVINVYMIIKTQLTPWYRWWQSARDIKLILENRKPFQLRHVHQKLQQQQQQQAICDSNATIPIETLQSVSPTTQMPFVSTSSPVQQ